VDGRGALGAGFPEAAGFAWLNAGAPPTDEPGNLLELWGSAGGLDQETQVWCDDMRQVAQALKGRFSIAEVLGEVPGA